MAAKNTLRSIFVYADWQGLGGPLLIGTLNVTQVRKEVFSFEYDEAWLKSGKAQDLDPDLQLLPGAQYLGGDKHNFGSFLDSSPDRWGRVLMDRREAIIARKEERKPNNLWETDYLLGVYDGHRMGALRFKEDPKGPFLNNNKDMASPPWTSIRELEHASLEFEKDTEGNTSKWIDMLFAPGSSLGGARPKASVVDPKGELWIAKFPSISDSKDVGAWEMVVHELALKAGIRVAESKTGKFYSKQHTFLTKRFDRVADGSRIHFASAMTLLGHTDGSSYKDGVSYLDLAEFIMRSGSSPNEDLEELWKRIVFNICVSNTDDHLRNHGFLLEEKGWKLSPAFDINPVAKGTGLSLNISEKDNSLDLDLAREVAPYFRIKDKKSESIVKEVKEVVAHWTEVAEKYGIPKTERELMASAFRV